MAEHRKPSFVFLLKNEGKKKSIKVELFDKKLWDETHAIREYATRYRIRVNGKWFDKTPNYKGRTYFTRWEFRDLLFRSIKI